MPANQTLRLTRCERIGRALDLVRPHLQARLQQELRGTPTARLPKNGDFAALLKLLLEHWNGALAAAFQPPLKHYAYLLRDVRNRCAHGDALSDREAQHAIATLWLLAEAIGAPRSVLDALDALASRSDDRPPYGSDDAPPAVRPVRPPPSPRPVRRDAAGVILNAEELTADEVAMQRVACPACNEKIFEEWSAGWDAHAGSASECRGLTASEYVERKAEFRRRFCHLFRPSTQRAAMRRWYGWLAPDEERIVREFAADERCGAVRRGSNRYGLSPEEYARRLLADGLKKGWLHRRGGPSA